MRWIWILLVAIIDINYFVTAYTTYVLPPLKLYNNDVKLKTDKVPPNQCSMKWRNLAASDPVQCDNFELNMHPYFSQTMLDCFRNQNNFNLYLKNDLLIVENVFQNDYCMTALLYATYGLKHERDGRLRDWRGYVDSHRVYFTVKTSLKETKCENLFGFRLVWVMNQNGSAFMGACSDEIKNEHGHTEKLKFLSEGSYRGEMPVTAYVNEYIEVKGARACPVTTVTGAPPVTFTNLPDLGSLHLTTTKKPDSMVTTTKKSDLSKTVTTPIIVPSTAPVKMTEKADDSDTDNVVKTSTMAPGRRGRTKKPDDWRGHDAADYGDYTFEKTTTQSSENKNEDEGVATASTSVSGVGPWIVIILASISVVVITAGFAFTIYKLYAQSAIIVEAVVTEAVPVALQQPPSRKSRRHHHHRKESKSGGEVVRSKRNHSTAPQSTPQNNSSKPSGPTGTNTKVSGAKPPAPIKLKSDRPQMRKNTSSKKEQETADLVFKSTSRRSNRVGENSGEKANRGNINVSRSDKRQSAQVADKAMTSITPDDEPSKKDT